MEALWNVWTHYWAVFRSRVGVERGASVIEYALLVSLIAAFCIAAVTMIGETTAASLSSTASRLP
ncbi:MAG TPA: hypothetical protein VHM89_12870 [Acidimicrobiales bacterium]|nr:hypothetical protein [Acidimicrobiales bacterium]